MNENIDLTKILKDCPKGERFWSPLSGEVEFVCISKSCAGRTVIECECQRDGWYFNADGTITIDGIQSQTIMLCPSKDQQDWSKFTAPWLKKERFDPNTLQPFDKVLVRDGGQHWRCDLFSHIVKNEATYLYLCVGSAFEYCIPYNDDTKHLVGTNKEAPEFYRYWED